MNYDSWFIFDPDTNLAASLISSNDLLHKPAGKYGFVQMKNDKMVCEDGTEIKFWGVNICSAKPYSDKKKVDKWCETLAAYGVNGVRFHKFTYHGFDELTSSDLAEEKYKHFDYFHSKLRSSGIYYGWSPIYGHKPRIGDRERLLAYDEIKNADMNSHLSGSTIGLVNFAEDIQDLHIELIVNMLNHKNPQTGLRYADDPALAFVEFQNEDNIFFATCDRMVELCPTYKKLLTQKFTNWLNEKYGSSEALVKEWGKEAFDWGWEVRKVKWDLEKGNITPVANHGIFEYEFNKYQSRSKAMPQFLLDMARFLYEEQIKFYKRFEHAVRATGYKGMLVASCWQAGSGVSHYYNLHADYLVGIIDRHNYFGGGTGHVLRPGKFSNGSMLSQPGSGLLSSGMQQVSDRPFSISEWLSLVPNEWIAEGPTIIAAYGLGLQGWDASFSFASDHPFFTETLHTPGVYNVMSPLQLALYPALARMVYRNDISEGEIISERNVTVPELIKGNLGFHESIKQNHDQKDYNGVVQQEALAVGKVIVNFLQEFAPTEMPDLSLFHDTQNKILKANTGELIWDYSGQGNFIINTDFTQAVVGFTDKMDYNLKDISIRIDNPFAIVILTSLDDNNSIADSDELLLTAVARARNTGMELNTETGEITNVGVSPILLEPVLAHLKFKNRIKPEIVVLNHTGAADNKKFEYEGDELFFDGSRYKTIYYKIIF